jgi:hypothetical protein
MLLAFALLMSAQAAEDASPKTRWIECLGEAAQTLAAAPDPASEVAAGAVSLCSEYEPAARRVSEAEAADQLVSSGVVGSRTEAARVIDSTGDAGWYAVVDRFRGLTAALVMKRRAQASPRSAR